MAERERGGPKWSSHSNHDRHTRRYIMAKDTPNWQKGAHHLLNVPPPTTPSQMTQYNLTDSPRNDGFTAHSPDILGDGGPAGGVTGRGAGRGWGAEGGKRGWKDEFLPLALTELRTT